MPKKGDTIINPKTGRRIRVGSRVWTKLARDGLLSPEYSTYENPQLYEIDKTPKNPVYTIDGNDDDGNDEVDLKDYEVDLKDYKEPIKPKKKKRSKQDKQKEMMDFMNEYMKKLTSKKQSESESEEEEGEVKSKRKKRDRLSPIEVDDDEDISVDMSEWYLN